MPVPEKRSKATKKYTSTIIKLYRKMSLDLIFFRPEFFYLFSFFVLLWYGTGNLVTPVAEILTVTAVNTQGNYH
jgi:hypothetical protein